MLTNTLVDLVKLNVTSTGTGVLTLGTAVPGYRGREALTNGSTYSYSIQQGDQYELGVGTYLSSGFQLVRSVNYSSNGNAAIDLDPSATVAFVASAADLLALAG